jgi:hypothetical protein
MLRTQFGMCEGACAHDRGTTCEAIPRAGPPVLVRRATGSPLPIKVTGDRPDIRAAVGGANAPAAPGFRSLSPCYRHDYLVMDRRSTATLICDGAGCCDLTCPQAPDPHASHVPGSSSQVNEAPLALLAPFEREQRLRKHRRWCAGICGNSLLQAAPGQAR